MAEHRSDPLIHWIAPACRGILPLDTFHVPRSLRKTIRQKRFEVCCNRDFHAVIHQCAAPRKDGAGTWINGAIVRVFTELHQLGYAHSVEAWQHGQLVGGLYGLALGGAFFGESMFSVQTDASKVALVYLAALLVNGGFALLDIQFITEHLSRFGAVEIPAFAYLDRLGTAIEREARFQSELSCSELDAAVSGLLMQSRTHTS